MEAAVELRGAASGVASGLSERLGRGPQVFELVSGLAAEEEMIEELVPRLPAVLLNGTMRCLSGVLLRVDSNRLLKR